MFMYSTQIGRGKRTIGNTGGENPGGGGEPVVSNIPLEWGDSRFAANTAGPYRGPGGPILVPEAFVNKDWDGGADLSSSDGNAVIAIWAEGTGEVRFTDCRFRWDEGPRLGAASTIHIIFDGCVSTGWGKELDAHVDLYQADGNTANCTMTNSLIRGYAEDEAKSVGGANAVGTDGFRWADVSSGTITFENVLIRGGGRGLAIAANAGDIHIAFENVYFVSEMGGFAGSGFYKMLIEAFNGYNIIIDKWINVCDATIVDGEIIPGTQHPEPESGTTTSYQVLG